MLPPMLSLFLGVDVMQVGGNVNLDSHTYSISRNVLGDEQGRGESPSNIHPHPIHPF